MGVTIANFMVPVFQGGDLCGIDINTGSFQVCLSAYIQNFEISKSWFGMLGLPLI